MGGRFGQARRDGRVRGGCASMGEAGGGTQRVTVNDD